MTEPLPALFEERWSLWLLDGNRRRLRAALFIASALYACFGVLDFLVARRTKTRVDQSIGSDDRGATKKSSTPKQA